MAPHDIFTRGQLVYGCIYIHIHPEHTERNPSGLRRPQLTLPEELSLFGRDKISAGTLNGNFWTDVCPPNLNKTRVLQNLPRIRKLCMNPTGERRFCSYGKMEFWKSKSSFFSMGLVDTRIDLLLFVLPYPLFQECS